jgi:hypothetical protein
MDRTVRPVPDRTVTVDRIGPDRGRTVDRTVPYHGPVNGGSVLSSPENGPCRPVPCQPVDRTGPDRGPCGTVDRTVPDRTLGPDHVKMKITISVLCVVLNKIDSFIVFWNAFNKKKFRFLNVLYCFRLKDIDKQIHRKTDDKIINYQVK